MLSKNVLSLTLFVSLVGTTTIPALAQGPTGNAASASPQVASENTAGVSGTTQTVTLQHRNQRYRLHRADVLELNFPFTAEFNQSVMVQPDGFVTLRGIDSIHVEGQTLPEVTTALQTAYAKILRDPVINVALKDFEKPFFIVGGEVGRPGKFDLREDTTTAEAVAIAGGLKDSAKHSEVVLFHRVPDGWVQAKKVNMKRILKTSDLNEDPFLQPGDFLYVPKSTFSKIAKFIPTSSLGLYANPGVL